MSQFNKEENHIGQILKWFCLKDIITYGLKFLYSFTLLILFTYFLLIFSFILNNITIINPYQIILSISDIYKSVYCSFLKISYIHQLFISLDMIRVSVLAVKLFQVFSFLFLLKSCSFTLITIIIITNSIKIQLYYHHTSKSQEVSFVQKPRMLIRDQKFIIEDSIYDIRNSKSKSTNEIMGLKTNFSATSNCSKLESSVYTLTYKLMPYLLLYNCYIMVEFTLIFIPQIINN